MGFDLYGLKPENTQEHKRPEYLDWSKNPTDKEKDKYFSKVDEFQLNVPGDYFRNNVWHWRPLWNFVCAACDDILTQKDVDMGSSNDGHRITKTKSKAIAARLRKVDKNGTLKEYDAEMNAYQTKAKEHNDKIQKKLDKLNSQVTRETGQELVPNDYPQPYADDYEELRNQRNWGASYPFDIENVRDFAVFCEESGGFEIC